MKQNQELLKNICMRHYIFRYKVQIVISLAFTECRQSLMENVRKIDTHAHLCIPPNALTSTCRHTCMGDLTAIVCWKTVDKESLSTAPRLLVSGEHVCPRGTKIRHQLFEQQHDLQNYFDPLRNDLNQCRHQHRNIRKYKHPFTSAHILVNSDG